MFKMLKKERGIALVTILILMGIISALIAALVLMSRTEMWLSLFGSKQRQALYMAETGGEQFIAALPFLGTVTRTENIALMNTTGSYTVYPYPVSNFEADTSTGYPGFIYTTQVIGNMPVANDTIRRTIEIEVVFRTGVNPSPGPNPGKGHCVYPWDRW
jgi:hypothetical protein